MAALGQIRKRGVILAIIIGLGLFAFIAEEAFRSCESSHNEQRQQIGEVLGQKVSAQDFQKLVEEYTDAVKFRMQRDNLTEDEMNQVRDQVWQQLISDKIMDKECKKLGLTVTDQELQNVLNQGTNQMLLSTPFINQQTGRFDANTLRQFLDEYNKAQTQAPQQAEQMRTLYNYWLFVEKSLRTQLLAQKYQGLLGHCFLSNKVEAKMSFKDDNEESNIQLASLAYSSIGDDKVKVTPELLKAKYKELKPAFRQVMESRDISYVDFQVNASAADRAALKKQFDEWQPQLAAAADPSDLVRKSTSLVPYLGLPVKSSNYPTDIKNKIDSMAVGTTGVTENKQDNTFNIIRLISKQQMPDSVQFRQIQVAAATPEEASKKADSIYNALQGGADFETIAKRYGQTGEKTWMTGQMYEQAQSMDKDNRNYINTLLTSPTNELKNLALTQGNVIVQVTDRRDMTDKVVAAVIKRTIDFSKDTYSKAYNKFSEFVSKSPDLETLKKNAPKYGYTVQTANDVTTATHYLAGIHSTRDAIKWLFQADEGDMSPLYECGDNNHLMVATLTKVHPQGYRELSDPQVDQIVRREVIRDLKAEQLIAKLQGVKSVNQAKQKGARITPVNQITFSAPAFVSATGAAEPALSGAVAAVKQGQFSKHPVKGLAGVYVFQVTSKKMRQVKYDEAAQLQRCRQTSLQYASNFMNDLVLKAGVVDNRYLFF